MESNKKMVQLTDEVKHKTFDVVGRVIDMYPSKEDPSKMLVDVDAGDGVVYHESFIENWGVLIPEEVAAPIEGAMAPEANMMSTGDGICPTCGQALPTQEVSVE